MHPRDHGIAQWENILSRDLTTLADVLKAGGYSTAAYVSHTVLAPQYGYDQGFDRYDCSILEKGHPHGVSSSKELTDKALGGLDELDTPFFIWVHYFDPHYKYISHEGFEFGPEAIDRYDSEIAYADYHIRRLVRGVEEAGVLARTIIVVASDHGEEFQDHGGTGHARTLYQELLRIPVIFHIPGYGHHEVAQTFVESDIAPTILELVELPIPEGFRGDAVSFTMGRSEPTSKVIFAETRRFADLETIIDGEYKLVVDHEEYSLEMYNLAEDPQERNDLAVTDQETATHLKRRLKTFYAVARAKAGTVDLDPQTLTALRDLGYLE
jgi:arylsulfatase A-like enzyme